jgi:hypothetical protein
MSRITTPTDPVLPDHAAKSWRWQASFVDRRAILRSTLGEALRRVRADTVAIEMPARAATSRMVGFFFTPTSLTWPGHPGVFHDFSTS